MTSTWKTRLRRRASALRQETRALAIAYRDPRTPWYARALTALTIAYALSPIDLIPDFVPVLGYLDDLVLVPLGIALAVRAIPREVMDDARHTAQSADETVARKGALLVIAVWLVALTICGVLLWRLLR